MSLKDKWKKAGKGMGESFSGLGKSIVKSAKVGVDELNGEHPKDEDGNPVDTGLKENWKAVGKSFGDTGAALGKAFAGTAKKVTDELDEAVNGDEQAEPKESGEPKSDQT